MLTTEKPRFKNAAKQVRSLSDNVSPIQMKSNQHHDSAITYGNYAEQDEMKPKPASQKGWKMNANNDELAKLQMQMESAFNADFSNVTIHENSTDAEKLNARAYTQGDEIHFAPGEFDTKSENGLEILGHELSHVVQQREGKVEGRHEEQGFMVNEDPDLEAIADRQGKKAAKGEQALSQSKSVSAANHVAAVQKKSQPIQLWRDVPGQARIESTAPDTQSAWQVFMRAAYDATGHAANAEGELRRLYYNSISQRMRGSFQPINIDAHTTSGFNHHWTGTIRFVFGDQETALEGGGAAPATLQSVSGSSNAMEGSSSNTTGSSGDVEGGYSQGEQGFSGTASAGGSGSSTTGIKETQSDTQTAGSTSQINQQHNRFSSTIGIEVNISVSYDMGSSWTDWINPAAYGAWGTSSLVLESGSATGECGTVIYYKGSGMVTSGK